MRRAISVFVISVLLLFLFCGCSNSAKDNVKSDLIQYVQTDLPGIKGEETAAVEKYNEVCSNIKNMDRSEVVAAFQDTIIPNYTTFCSNLEKLAPKTQEVQTLKEEYVSGVKLQLEGMKELQKAIEDNSSDAAKAANDKITEGKTKIEAHRTAVVQLATAHDITVNVDGSSSKEGK